MCKVYSAKMLRVWCNGTRFMMKWFMIKWFMVNGVMVYGVSGKFTPSLNTHIHLVVQ